MDRIQELDQEMAHCLHTLETLLPLSSRSGNPNMVFAAEIVIRSLSSFHQQKLRLVEEMRRAGDHFSRPFLSEDVQSAQDDRFQTPPRFQTPSPFRFQNAPRSSYPEPEDDGPMDLSELDLPLQLADLMETELDQSIIDGDSQEEDPWGDDDNEPLDPHVSIRPRRHTCIRHYTETDKSMSDLHEETCNVCFETPKTENACVTNCGHHFCKTCFNQWETARFRAGGIISCPCCRATHPVVVEYIAPGTNI